MWIDREHVSTPFLSKKVSIFIYMMIISALSVAPFAQLPLKSSPTIENMSGMNDNTDCNKWGKLFSRKNNLITIKKPFKQKQEVFNCEYCDNQFSTKSA